MESKGITVEIDYEKFIKALTDLIDSRIDKRLENITEIVNKGLGKEIKRSSRP